jgi:MFS transporter, DHA1 family, multidrug resistance protein
MPTDKNNLAAKIALNNKHQKFNSSKKSQMIKKTASEMPFLEFITLMALYVAMMAMSIDMVLPSLSIIGKDFNVLDENKTQFIISVIFLGFTFGQIIYGPVADSFGRKPTLYIGFIVFACGSFLCLVSQNFETILMGRFLQGLGAASPRIVSTAIIRDLYKGREMARIMSFIMTIFIIIPVIAPSIGQAILLFANWRVMFAIFLAVSLIAMLWTSLHLPETLKPQDARPFNFKAIKHDILCVLNNKTTLNYAICAGLIFGALIGYLTSSRQIFENYFQVGKLFPIYFGISALSIGIASIVNSAIVRRFGMKLISEYSLIAMITISILSIILLVAQNNQIALWQFMCFIIATFFCLGLLFGNLNALAMEPMQHYAGIASAIVGSISSGVSVILGAAIGQAYNNSVMPMFLGFLFLSISSFMLHKKVNKKT